MVLGWFGGAKVESLPELIARKKYAQAVEVLRAQAQRGGGRDPRLRMQLADILDAAGRRAEAIPIYLELADGFAREGYVAKAIAVLKKVERIDQGRADVKRRLEQLAAERRRPRSEPDSMTTQTLEIGMEEIGLAPNLYESSAAIPRPARPARPAEAPEEPHAVFVTPVPAAADPGTLDAELRHRVDEAEFDLSDADPLSEVLASQPDAAEPSEAVFEEEFFDALVETVKAAGSETAPEEPSAPPRAVRSPLFEDFTDEEFIAIAAQMELHSFGAGDIVITEGDPGDSLFVLTTGVVKAFVRNSAGRHVLVREMGEGSFFGEISILTRRPRTATVTCATSCDLLELDRDALDGIAAKHPRVHQVLRHFYAERHGSGEEKRVRGTEAAAQK